MKKHNFEDYLKMVRIYLGKDKPMKYFAEKGSNKELAVGGVVMARAQGCVGFNESEVAYPSDEVLRWAKGYREDHIPQDLTVELVEVTEEMINSVLGKGKS